MVFFVHCIHHIIKPVYMSWTFGLAHHIIQYFEKIETVVSFWSGRQASIATTHMRCHCPSCMAFVFLPWRYISLSDKTPRMVESHQWPYCGPTFNLTSPDLLSDPKSGISPKVGEIGNFLHTFLSDSALSSDTNFQIMFKNWGTAKHLCSTVYNCLKNDRWNSRRKFPWRHGDLTSMVMLLKR